jgi:hypothetical protein
MDENIEIDKSKNVENIIESKEEIDAFLLLLGKLDEQTKLIFVLTEV